MPKITITKSELDRMSPDDLCALLLRASKIQATCVVQRADGSIKYDDPALAGTYGEEHLSPRKDAADG